MISALLVKNLREKTGAGMMDCKKALEENNGDFEQAIDYLRKKGAKVAANRGDRDSKEGVVLAKTSADNKRGILIWVNCETDFVAKDDSFIAFADQVAAALVENQVTTAEELAELKLASGKTVEETRKDIIAKLGENISVRRFQTYTTEGVLASYLHGKKIGVLVDLNGDVELGRDIAMHVAASKPVCVSKENVDAEKIEEERRIYSLQAAESGKPAEIVAKMVDGRIAKFLAEITLLGQPFVKNPDLTVEKLLASKNAKVNSFTMFVVGEGIEKKVVDFAAEVAAAAIV